MKSQWIMLGLEPNDWCLYKKRRRHRETRGEKQPHEDRCIGVMHISQGTSRFAGNHQELGGSMA